VRPAALMTLPVAGTMHGAVNTELTTRKLRRYMPSTHPRPTGCAAALRLFFGRYRSSDCRWH
jgi:hypothetical protein